jgi:hypothetical protein
MKKMIAVLFAAVILAFFAAGSAFAADDIVELSGEIKTGFFTEHRELKGQTYSSNGIYNNDGDSGPTGSRLRIGINLHTRGIGIRTRFAQQNFSLRNKDGINDTSLANITTDFAYVYANMFNSQLKISGGLLGESPWGTGGPQLGMELENDNGNPITGIRVEWKPTFSPYIRGLNLGFVLNRQDGTIPADATVGFGQILRESIVGIAWEQQYFTFRFAYRFDQGIDSPAAVVNGEKFVYRFEERLLWLLLPGLQITANGYCTGILPPGMGTGSDRGGNRYIENWFYLRYDPVYFTTGFDVKYYYGFKQTPYEKRLEIRPYFYYKLINNYLVAGAMGGMEIGYDAGKSIPDAPYNFWFVEPQVKVNVNNYFYIAAVYRYTQGAYLTETSDKDQKTHWVNLRMCYTF